MTDTAPVPSFRRGDQLTTPVRVRVAVLLVALVLIASVILALFFWWELNRSDARSQKRGEYLECVVKNGIAPSIKALDHIVNHSIIAAGRIDPAQLMTDQAELAQAQAVLENLDKTCKPPR